MTQKKERQRWREGTEGGRKSAETLVFIDATLRKQTTDKTQRCLWVIFSVAKSKTNPPPPNRSICKVLETNWADQYVN